MINKKRGAQLGQRRALKHKCNEEYFNNVKNEKQAYLLGFLVADGNVCLTQGYKISLTSIDFEIIKNFKKELNATHPIRKRKDGSWEIILSSKKLVDGLKQYNCCERKSLTATWPKKLKPKLYQHYIRGLFDGDGGIGFDKRKNAFWCFVGSKNIVNNVSKTLFSRININMSVRKHGKIWRIDAHGNHKVLTITNYLYKKATIYLSRKYRLANKIVLVYNKKRRTLSKIRS